MRILFVTLYSLHINTSVTKSNWGLIRGLLQLGHKVTVVMPEVDKSLSYYDKSYDLSALSIITIPNRNIGEQLAIINNNGNTIIKGVLRFCKKIYNAVSVFDRSKALLSEVGTLPLYSDFFDIVISTSDPKTSHLMVKAMIKKGLKCGRWIQHWGDPLYGDVSSKTILPSFYLKMIERNMISKADNIVYVSPFTANMKRRDYKSIAHKIKFVPLACDDNECKSTPNISNNNNILNVVYLGDYSSHIRNIYPLYFAVKRLPNIKLIIAGNSDVKLEPYLNIDIYPRVKQDKVKELEEKADIIVSIGNIKGTQIPGKIYYASSSLKEILVTIDGDNKKEMKEYLSTFRRFQICNNEEEDIYNKLQEIATLGVKVYSTPTVLKPANIAKAILNNLE